MSTMALGINDRVQVMNVDDIGTTMHGFVQNVQNARTGKYRSSAPTINGLNDFGQIVRSTSTRTGNTDGFVGTPK